MGSEFDRVIPRSGTSGFKYDGRIFSGPMTSCPYGWLIWVSPSPQQCAKRWKKSRVPNDRESE
jgi:hypothetical protein